MCQVKRKNVRLKVRIVLSESFPSFGFLVRHDISQAEKGSRIRLESKHNDNTPAEKCRTLEHEMMAMCMYSATDPKSGKDSDKRESTLYLYR